MGIEIDTPRPKGLGFLLQPALPLKAVPLDGLTRCPQADAVCPTAKIRKPSSLMHEAALMSLSWVAPHLGHCQLRTSKLKLSTRFKQLLQVFELGKNLSTST